MNQSKKLAKTLVVIATATSVSVQYPTYTKPIHILAESIDNPIVKSNVNTESIHEIELGHDEAEVRDEMINITLSQNGKYRIKGSNLINDAYICTKITVPEGVTVDLYFAGASIENRELRLVDYGCGKQDYETVTPLVVEGTANIYVEDDTTISGRDNLLTVTNTGTVNIMESKNNALLTIQTIDNCPGGDPNFRMTNDSGTINIINGNILFKNQKNTEKKENYNTKFHFMGGTVKFDSCRADTDEEIIFNNVVIIDGGIIEGIDFSKRDAKNSNDEPLSRQSFGGITGNTNIILVGDYKQNSLVTDAEGYMKNIYVPKEKDVVLYTENKAYIYKYQEEGYSAEPEEKNVYTVTLILDDKEFASYLVKENDTLKLPTDSAYDYTFTSNGTAFTEETKITDNTEVIMQKSIKIFDVKISDTIYKMQYGTLLKNCSGYKVGEIYTDESGNIHMDDYSITSNVTLTKLDLEYIIKDNKRFITIASAEQLMQFATFVNTGHTSLNGLLIADITDNFTTTIGIDTNRYIGTFDGQGHSVQLNINSSEDYQGMFGAVDGGAIIKNVVTKGTVKGAQACGGIIGGSRGSGKLIVDGCINYADVTGSTSDAGGIIGTNTNNELKYEITNCGNFGYISGSNFSCGICGFSGDKATIDRCYNVGEVGNNYDNKCFVRGSNIELNHCYQIDTVQEQSNVTSMNEAAFHSGEVTYKLNGDQSNITWLQTCGTGYPIINGNKETQTVYYGYQDCTATEKSYINIDHLEQGHKCQYELNDKQITADCAYCENQFTADLSYGNCIYDGEKHGVDITYGTDWEGEGLPKFTVMYANQVDGAYSEEIPVEAGTWYAKICINGTEEPVVAPISFAIQKLYEVTVNGGRGSGSYGNGDQVVIIANPADSGKMFTGWTIVNGSEVTFDDATKEKTTFTMPAEAVIIQANYTGIPEQNPTPQPSPNEGNDNNKEEIEQDGNIDAVTDEKQEDGSTSKTEEEILKDGTKKTTVTTISKDGRTTQNITLTEPDGSTTVTITNPDGSSEYQKTFTDPNTMAEVLITVKKNTQGEIISSQANITAKGIKNSNKTKISIMSSLIDEIKKFTQSDLVDIIYHVTNEKGDSCYNVEVSSADFVAKNKLSVYIYDNKLQKYIPTSIKDITVNKSNSISINLPNLDKKEYSYKLVNKADKEVINRDIMSRITLKKKSITLKVGKKTKISFAKLDMDTVSKIKYTSVNKKIATVDQKGNIVAKKKGKNVIKVTVKLKNKETKVLNVNITVK